jgi:monofunctional biosynthetic peptidoglycan transglycosylase
VVFYGACTLALVGLRYGDPPTTAVHAQRRAEAWFDGEPYTKRYTPVGLERISPHLQRAVVVAEDSRFYTHGGIDWRAVQDAMAERRRSIRGASTITQQLVKNLFLTTRRSVVRKALEGPLAYLAEIVLGKRRILELYLNVVEWGPGVYGAEAAARYHFGVAAARLDRPQAAGLAACLPDPRARTPVRASAYRTIIQRRMGASRP